MLNLKFNILKFLTKSDIGNPLWEYDFLQNLEESEYPKYLAKIFNYRTGEKLALKRVLNSRVHFSARGQGLWNYIIDKNKCKTFNQKIQWIKLYDETKLKSDCNGSTSGCSTAYVTEYVNWCR